MYDFHTHTFLSDGVLSPIELIRRAYVRGYAAMAVTDHVGIGNVELVVNTLVTDCAAASSRWDILALPGVEITHVPKEDIDAVAKAAKGLGAQVVVVHGETVVEPVEPGTNRAALNSKAVDILAHPGLIQLEDARLASEGGIFLEVSARRGHSFTNGHVVRVALEAGCLLLLDSDAHEPEDLLDPELSQKIALGCRNDPRGCHCPSGNEPQEIAGQTAGSEAAGLNRRWEAASSFLFYLSGLADPKHLGPTFGADPLGGGPPVLQGNLSWVTYFPLGSALKAISFHIPSPFSLDDF